MAVHVVVEGESDRELFLRILRDPTVVQEVQFHVARGKHEARPWARRIQRERHEPVLLVVDADTDDENKAREEEREYTAYLGYSSGGVPYHVAVLVPEAEVLLFKVPGLVPRLVGSVSPELLEVARSAPRKAIDVLFKRTGTSLRELFTKLTEEDLEQIRSLPEVARAREFLRQQADRRLTA